MSRPSDRRQRKRKKREKRKRQEKNREQSAAKSPGPSPDFSPFTTERMLGGLTSTGRGQSRDDAAQLAQELAWRAGETEDPNEALDCIKRALALDPDCVDAITLVASGLASKDERLAALRSAVAAGERKLGEKFFDENRGHFWGLLETRPYMRARAALADWLAKLGQLDEAIAHVEETLELDPDDHMGVRHSLVGYYLAAGRSDDARKLLDRFDEDDFFATAAWARVLERLLSGDEQRALSALANARERNASAERYLTGRKPLPKSPPAMFSPGDENEAIICALELAPAWETHASARDWLRDQTDNAEKIASAPAPSATTAPRVTRLDDAMLQQIADEIESRLAPLEESLGVHVALRDWRADDTNGIFRIEVASVREDGIAMTSEAESFLNRAESFGLSPTDLGRTVTIRGGGLQIIGAPPRKKNVVICKDLADHKRYLVPANLIRHHLGRTDMQQSFLAPEFVVDSPQGSRQTRWGLCPCGSGARFESCCLAKLDDLESEATE